MTNRAISAPRSAPGADDALCSPPEDLPTGVRILRMLAKKEARTCSHIVDELPLAQSTVSEHLRFSAWISPADAH